MDEPEAFFPGTPGAVLVVDDDAQVLKWVSRMLASIGRTSIHSASSPGEALEVWQEHRNSIEILVSDFIMPEMTGDRLAVKLLENNPHLKVLFISGNDPGSLESEIPLENGQNFLQKPFTVADIRRSIESLALLV